MCNRLHVYKLSLCYDQFRLSLRTPSRRCEEIYHTRTTRSFSDPHAFSKMMRSILPTPCMTAISLGTFPVNKKLRLEPIDALKADFFLECRELGIINAGGKGKVTVEGKPYELRNREALYVGCGNKEVIFEAADGEQPYFYINSDPAHKENPTKKSPKTKRKSSNWERVNIQINAPSTNNWSTV